MTIIGNIYVFILYKTARFVGKFTIRSVLISIAIQRKFLCNNLDEHKIFIGTSLEIFFAGNNDVKVSNGI